MQEIQKMARDVEISLLDVIESTYPKSLKQSEPVMLRRSEVIKQIGAISKPSMRLATSGSEIDVNSDTELGNALQQYATVDEVQGVHDIATQGFQDITVKYCCRFITSTNSPYNVVPVASDISPSVGDLAISPYWVMQGGDNLRYHRDRAVFKDSGHRNGLTGGSLYGVGFPVYRYDGTGWKPVVLDTATVITKYRIKVLFDYKYFYTDLEDFPAYNNYDESYYNLVYIPHAGVEVRSARFLNVADIYNRLATFDCGSSD